MESSKVLIGSEEWTVHYIPKIIYNNQWVAAARVPHKKEIWLSLNDKDGNKIPPEKVTAVFQKTILPLVIEYKKKEFGEEKVNKALAELGIKV